MLKEDLTTTNVADGPPRPLRPVQKPAVADEPEPTKGENMDRTESILTAIAKDLIEAFTPSARGNLEDETHLPGEDQEGSRSPNLPSTRSSKRAEAAEVAVATGANANFLRTRRNTGTIGSHVGPATAADRAMAAQLAGGSLGSGAISATPESPLRRAAKKVAGVFGMQLSSFEQELSNFLNENHDDFIIKLDAFINKNIIKEQQDIPVETPLETKITESIEPSTLNVHLSPEKFSAMYQLQNVNNINAKLPGKVHGIRNKAILSAVLGGL